METRKTIDKKEIHNQIRYMINWFEESEYKYSSKERLRRLAGIEILLYILGWFPNNKLPVKQVEERYMVFPFVWKKRMRKERYDELMFRLIDEYKIKHGNKKENRGNKKG